MVDYGISKDTVEPRRNFFVRHTGAAFQAAGEGRLQNVLGGFAGFHAPLQERQEFAMSRHELLDGFGRQGLGGFG
jgi:hypothetical protein